jgi:hypothetical protein
MITNEKYSLINAVADMASFGRQIGSETASFTAKPVSVLAFYELRGYNLARS